MSNFVFGNHNDCRNPACTVFFGYGQCDSEIKAYGIRYLRVIFIGSLFVNFIQSANMVMRGEGLMKKAMMIMGLGALLNIILDPILMTVMGEYAIEGAALATITAQIVQAIVTLHYFLKKSKPLKSIRLIRMRK